MDQIITTDRITKVYPGKVAVNEVSMNVRRGDIYGLIGKNGAGKTTLMKMILGLTLPTKGSLTLFGSDDVAARRKRIGSLIEEPGLYKNCSAKENMKRFSLLYGANEAKIPELLALVGLKDVGNKKVSAYSLGMKQRLGLAIALLNDPELLVLDEPINGLDPSGIKDMRDLFVRLSEERGVTLLISSHILDELSKIATVYGIMNNGRLVEEISAEELAEKCVGHIRITCDDNAAAQAILKENLPEIATEIRSDGLYLMSSEIDAAKVNALLVAGGVAVSAVQPSGDDFENFFIQRLG